LWGIYGFINTANVKFIWITYSPIILRTHCFLQGKDFYSLVFYISLISADVIEYRFSQQ